jgi:hypothetical protein
MTLMIPPEPPCHPRLVAAEQIRDWQRRGVSPQQACGMLGVLHSRSWDVVCWHLVQAQGALEAARRGGP